MVGSDAVILTSCAVLLVILQVYAFVHSCIVLNSIVINRIIPYLGNILHRRADDLVELPSFLLLRVQRGGHVQILFIVVCNMWPRGLIDRIPLTLHYGFVLSIICGLSSLFDGCGHLHLALEVHLGLLIALLSVLELLVAPVDQVVARSDVIMSIVLYTLLSILAIKVEFFDNLVEQFLFDGHFLLAWEEALVAIAVLDQEGPSVVPYLVYSVPLLGIRIQNTSDDVLALARKKLRQRILSSHDLFIQIRRLWVLEGQVTADHGVEYHATAPDISLQAVVPLAGDHLWGRVAGRAARRLKRRSRLIHIAEAEVNNLESQVVIQKQVLRLEVSVAHSALVDVLDAGDELEVELACLLLGEARMPHNIIKQLSATAVLHDHVQLLFSFNYLIKLNHIRVSDLLEDFDLPRDSFDVLLIINLVFLQNLDGYFLTCERMLAQLDLSESSLAQMLACKFLRI